MAERLGQGRILSKGFSARTTNGLVRCELPGIGGAQLSVLTSSVCPCNLLVTLAVAKSIINMAVLKVKRAVCLSLLMLLNLQSGKRPLKQLSGREANTRYPRFFHS